VTAPLIAQTTFTKKRFDTALDPSCVAWGDFNGDGKWDFATASFSEHAVAVQYGDGNGDFSVPSKFSTGGAPSCVYMADLNDDSKPDLILPGTGANTEFGITVLLGNGDGTFAGPKFTPLARGVQDLAIFNFDGDPRVDLATVDSTTNVVQLLAGKGDGTFTVTSYTVPTDTLQLRSIVASDFNNDGKYDLAVLSCCAGTETDPLGRIYTLTGDAAGHFSSKVGIEVRAIGTRMVSGFDFDRDGGTDIVLTYANSVSWANKNGVAILAGNHNGYFRVLRTAGIPAGYDGPLFGATLADFDHNGHLDIALPITKNAENTSGDPSLSSAYLAFWYFDPDGTQRASTVLPVSDPGYPTGIAPWHINEDDWEDIGMVARAGNGSTAVIFINDAGGAGACSSPSSATGIHICSPAGSSTVTDPVQVTAKGGSAVTTLEAWIDGTKRGQVRGTELAFSVTLSSGPHKLTVFAKSNGTVTATQVVNFSVN